MQSEIINETETLCKQAPNELLHDQFPKKDNNELTTHQTIDPLQSKNLTKRQNKPSSLKNKFPLKKLNRNNKIKLDLSNSFLINNKLNYDDSLMKNNKKQCMTKKLSSPSLPLTNTNTASSLYPLNKSSTTAETNDRNKNYKKKSKTKCFSVINDHSKREDDSKTTSHVTKITQKIDQKVNKYRVKSKSQQKINFDKTYERFMEGEKKRKKEILSLKKRLEEADNRIYNHKPQLSKCESVNRSSFLERIEKYKEEHKHKSKLLREKLLKEEFENINNDNILLKKNTKNKKINVEESVQNLFDWERQRKQRIEREKQKLDDIINRTCRDAPKITKYKLKEKNKNKNIIYRLYDAYFIEKSKKKLKTRVSLSPFSVYSKILENKFRRNASQAEFQFCNINVDKNEENNTKTLEIKNTKKRKIIKVIRKIKK